MFKEKKEGIKELLYNFSNMNYSLIFQGIIIGIFGGLIVVLYRFLLSLVSGFIYPLYSTVSNDPIKIILMFAILGLCGYIVGYIIKIEPMIIGSGIPQVAGELIGKMKIKWIRVIILKFIGGIISLGAGLSLGREGPSIQIGAATGLGISRFFKSDKTKEKFLITCGAAAGLSSAFNAPLAGVLFAMEELHKSFSSMIFIGAMCSAITADYVSKIFFGRNPVFSFPLVKTIPLREYPYLILLGVFLGVLGVLFNKSIIFSIRRYSKIFTMPVQFKPIIPFLFTGFIGMMIPILLGGGHELIVSIVENDNTILFLFSILIFKFIFTLVSYSSQAPGGIFLPLLSIGAIGGCFLAKIFVVCFGMNPEYIDTFIILAMAGYFTAVVKSPITGIILITEMTGGLGSFLSISIVSIVAYVTSDILKGEPVYEMLLKNTLKGRVQKQESYEKILLEIPINIGTIVANKKIMSLELPENILLISIKRNGEDIIPKGHTRLINGDTLTILTEENRAQEIKSYFLKEKQ